MMVSIYIINCESDFVINLSLSFSLDDAMYVCVYGRVYRYMVCVNYGITLIDTLRLGRFSKEQVRRRRRRPKITHH